MKKYYLKSGKEVHIGDTICREISFNHYLYGDVKMTEAVLVTDDNIQELISEDIIKVKENKKQNKPCCDSNLCNLDFYLNKIANRLGWRPEKVFNYINNLGSISIAAVFSIISKEIAIELDKKYPDYINDSPEIYGISLTNGKIIPINKKTIKNYRNFAAFRTIEDAKIACNITRNLLKEMFKSDKNAE